MTRRLTGRAPTLKVSFLARLRTHNHGQVRTLPSDRIALPDDLSTFAQQVDRLCCADFRQFGW